LRGIKVIKNAQHLKIIFSRDLSSGFFIFKIKMSFSVQIFGKHIFDLNIEDVYSFFQLPREENQNLEFKSGEVQIESIYKEICAFLNSSGGFLIIGTPKETSEIVNGREIKICKGYNLTYLIGILFPDTVHSCK